MESSTVLDVSPTAVAAVGGHHMLIVGDARDARETAVAVHGALPPLDVATAADVTRCRSAAGLPFVADPRPPLRAPAASTTMVTMLGGGGATMRPGEVALAHGGILFLGDLPEFSAMVLDGLRQPFDEGIIRVSRGTATVEFPARVQVVASMLACPSGCDGVCGCSAAAKARWRRRVTGPLMDRFELRVGGDDVTGPVGPVDAGHAAAAARGCRSVDIPVDRLDEFAPMTTGGTQFAHRALQEGRITARGLVRLRRVARTALDLQGRPADPIDIDAAEAALNLITIPKGV